MYHILVAEDEAPILRSICKQIEACNENFHVTATARNGRNAMELLEQQSFDVVFLDINMPVFSGLDVLEALCKRQSGIIPVILTGYEEFEYIQQAMRSGAIDYLLKPLKKNELVELLNKIESKLTKQRIYEMMKFYTMQDAKVNSFLCSHSETYAAIVYLGSFQLQQDEMLITPDIIQAEQWLQQLFDCKFGLDHYCLISKNRYSQRLLLADACQQQSWTELSRFLDNYPFHIPITIIAADVPIASSRYVQVCNLLRQFARHMMYFEESQVQFVTADQLKCGVVPDQSDDTQFLEQLKRTASLEQAESVYETYIFSLSRPTRYRVLRITKIFINIVFADAIKYGIQVDRTCFDMEEIVLPILERSYDRKILCQNLNKVLAQNLHAQSVPINKHEQIAAQMHSYLQSNFDQLITMERLEQKFGYVASYLRKVFRSSYGVAPLEYLLQLRINQSKQFLLAGTSAKEAAFAVGFRDPLYFSKVFKKNTGMTPSEFRAGNDD